MSKSQIKRTKIQKQEPTCFRRDLEKKIQLTSGLYYKGTPIISDAEFDDLVDKLKKLDPNSAILKQVGSPSPPDSPLVSLDHKLPMYSLNKCSTQDEFEKWTSKTKASLFVIQEKLDGLSVELVYKKGKLIQAILRGDGKCGESVLHQVKVMSGVQSKLRHAFTGSLRGEIIMPLSNFNQYFQDGAFSESNRGYQNPRNAAVGITRRKKASKDASLLKLIYFDCVCDEGPFETEQEKMEFIRDVLRLEIVFTKKVGVENAIKWYKRYEEKQRERLDHEADGLVIKVDNIARQKKLGMRNNRPKGQIAWKFRSRDAETRLKSVRWDVGLTGRLTPVAHLEPVEIGGVTVRKATLHNVSYIKKLGLTIGAKVLISRRGDVIPCVEKALTKTNRKIEIPKKCPICRGETGFECKIQKDIKVKGEYLFCLDPDCKAKQRGNIKKWIKILDIEEAGDSFIDLIVNVGWVKDPADLYTLDLEELANCTGYGPRSAEIVIGNIRKKMTLTLSQFCAGLNILDVSIITFEKIEDAGINTLNKLSEVKFDTLATIPGIGNATAEAIIEGLRQKKVLIKKLIMNGVIIKKEKKMGNLSGISFCFTGELSIKRTIAGKMVKDMGGEVKSGVSKGLTYLVQTDPSSQTTKTQKARKYGTRVIGEDEFRKMVDFSLEKLEKYAK